MDQYYYKLIEDYSKKIISSENLTDLMVWVESHYENQQAFREVLHAFESADHLLNRPVDQQKSWSSIQKHIEQTSVEELPVIKKVNWTNWIRLIAAVIIVAIIPLLYFNSKKKKTEFTYNEIYNPRGQKRLVILPDGTNIYLNGDTKIRYAQNFNIGKRIVYLDGEAFFDVQHRSKQPFIVNTKNVSTTVLGTSFNINAYSSLKNIAITVKTGKVGIVVKNKTGTKTVHFLFPNEQLNVLKDEGVTTKEIVNASEIDSWREYRLIFYNKPIDEIVTVIAREYDLDILIKSEDLKKTKLTAKFNKCSVKQIMDELSNLSGSKYTIYENKVIIY